MPPLPRGLEGKVARGRLGLFGYVSTPSIALPDRFGCCQNCCQGHSQLPTPDDKPGISAQHVANIGRSWTVRPCLRIRRLGVRVPPSPPRVTGPYPLREGPFWCRWEPCWEPRRPIRAPLRGGLPGLTQRPLQGPLARARRTGKTRKACRALTGLSTLHARHLYSRQRRGRSLCVCCANIPVGCASSGRDLSG